MLCSTQKTYQVASWYTSHLATVDMGQKLGVGCAIFFWGSWAPIEQKVAWVEGYVHTKWHLSSSTRLATMNIGRNLGAVTDRTDRQQRSGSTGRTVLQTVAQKLC